jgi:hypothetical protein
VANPVPSKSGATLDGFDVLLSYASRRLFYAVEPQDRYKSSFGPRVVEEKGERKKRIFSYSGPSRFSFEDWGVSDLLSTSKSLGNFDLLMDFSKFNPILYLI